jgi:hypothetical protein
MLVQSGGKISAITVAGFMKVRLTTTWSWAAYAYRLAQQQYPNRFDA